LHQEEPKYFMSVLTNVDGNHYYCAVLSFYEKISIVPSKPVDEEEENITLSSKQIIPAANTITHHNIMYAPKCLVLVSRLDYSETFKNCLKTIYTVYLENLPFSIATLIGNILGCIQIPSAGGPQVRFSIGAGDKQALQPPLSATLPGKNRK
jgi:myotubularin-related protein 5/13